jgi:putative ABC transport system permease protein
MAADLTARQFTPPSDREATQLEALASKGIDKTVITETVSMVSSTVPDAVPVLVSLKAVDPAKYPYYGSVKLSPAIPLAQALQPETVAAGEDVLIRLGVKTGDPVKVGNQTFRVAAIVISEPDRMSGSLNVGLRMMLSREALERTGLMQIGSRAAQRHLFKLESGGPDVESARALIKEALPNALVADSSESHPLITRGLNRATTFLSLVSLIALIVGAIGVAMAMYAHLQQKMDNIAVMKTLGGTSAEIIRIFTLQTLLLGLLGGVIGVLAGRGVESFFPKLVSQIFDIQPPTGWHLDAAIQGILAGTLTTLLFTLPPLLAIRNIKPAYPAPGDARCKARLAGAVEAFARIDRSGRLSARRPRGHRGMVGRISTRRWLLCVRTRVESCRAGRRRVSPAARYPSLPEAPSNAALARHAPRSLEPAPPRQPSPGDPRRAEPRCDVHA